MSGVPRLLRRTEKQVQRDVKRVLELYGYAVSDLSQPRATMQTPGLPDLYAQHPKHGIRFWVEVKAPDGRLTDAQKAWHEFERQAGGAVFVVHSAYEMREYLMGRAVAS